MSFENGFLKRIYNGKIDDNFRRKKQVLIVHVAESIYAYKNGTWIFFLFNDPVDT
jgi:hypothetical protein